MDDADGPFIAKEIYSAVFKDGSFNLTVVPFALDGALRKLRAAGRSASHWATYVHVGL